MTSNVVVISIAEQMLRSLLSVKRIEAVNFFNKTLNDLASEHILSIDQSWDAIVRCLGNGSLRIKRNRPTVCVVYGDNIAFLPVPNVALGSLDINRVAELSSALDRICQREFEEKYWMLKRTFLGIDVSSYCGPITREDLEFTLEHFLSLVAFFRRSAEQGRAIATLRTG